MADPVCAYYDISGMACPGYAIIYRNGLKSWSGLYIEEEFELDE